MDAAGPWQKTLQETYIYKANKVKLLITITITLLGFDLNVNIQIKRLI